MITKLLKVIVKNELNEDEVNLILTYQTKTISSKILIKEKISTYHSQYPETRYIGNTPIIFIRLEDVEDFEFLEFVNRLRLFIDDNEENIILEKDIISVLDIHYGKDKYSVEVEKFDEEKGYVMLRRPYASFRPFTNKMFVDKANSIVENAMNGVENNE